MNRLCRILEVELPIVQAPIGSVATPELAAAVSNAGGLGSLGVTWTPPDLLRERIRSLRRLTLNPFFLNFALDFEPAGLPLALEEGAPIITFSWGDPSPHVDALRRHGVKWGVQVGAPSTILSMLPLEPDFLILQGSEAGGHVQGTAPLMEMLPEAIELAKGMPVVVAGGLATGAQIRQALEAGASGAMLGTRFVCSLEADAHPDYQRLLVDAKGTETKLTFCFDGGWPNAAHRVLRNATLRRWDEAGEPKQNRPGEGDVVGRTATGEPILRYEDTAPRRGYTGEIEAMCLYSGTGVGEIEEVVSAREIVHRLCHEAGL